MSKALGFIVARFPKGNYMLQEYKDELLVRQIIEVDLE